MQSVILTQREKEVMDALLRGLTVTKDIAALLKLSPRTVSVYKYHIYQKLSAHSVAEVLEIMRNKQVDL